MLFASYEWTLHLPFDIGLGSWLSARRANLCVCKEGPTQFETSWLQEIPFSKELTDNYW